MESRVEGRLTELRAEYERGQRLLEELELRRNEVQTTLLRIAGAMQVLEELLAESEPVPMAKIG